MYVYWLVVTGTCLLLFHRLGLIIQLYFSEGLKPPTSLYIYIYTVCMYIYIYVYVYMMSTPDSC